MQGLNCTDFIRHLIIDMTLVNIKIMGFPTKIQLIKRPKSEQWYINFPSALAKEWNLNVER